MATTSRMHRHAPFEPIDPNICMWVGVADVINCAKFFENPSKGFAAVRPRKIAFPVEIVHRPYNSVGTTVPHCDVTKGQLGDVYIARLPTRSLAQLRLPIILQCGLTMG